MGNTYSLAEQMEDNTGRLLFDLFGCFLNDAV